jgi:hypothetical protein
MEQVASDLAGHFESLVELPVPNRGNVICLAGRGDMMMPFVERGSSEIRQLQQRFDINFREIVRVGRKYNLNFLQRLSNFFN